MGTLAPATTGQCPRRNLLLGLLLLLGLGGSSGCIRLEDWTHALEERHVHSCVYTTGFVFPLVLARTITATGAATIAECHAFR